MILMFQAAVKNCRICQHCCAFTVVKYVKETCKTVHRQLRTGCLSILMFLTPLAEVTP